MKRKLTYIILGGVLIFISICVYTEWRERQEIFNWNDQESILISYDMIDGTGNIDFGVIQYSEKNKILRLVYTDKGKRRFNKGINLYIVNKDKSKRYPEQFYNTSSVLQKYTVFLFENIQKESVESGMILKCISTDDSKNITSVLLKKN